MECHPCFYLLAFPCCFTPSLASCLFSPVSPSRHGSPHLNSFVAPPQLLRRPTCFRPSLGDPRVGGMLWKPQCFRPQDPATCFRRSPSHASTALMSYL